MPGQKNDTKQDELIALMAEFRGKLEGETERGLAIVGAAFLDDALKELLRAYLMDDPKKVVNGLLGGSFGSFKKRCDFPTS